jgi:hypothetical protein
MMKSEKTCLFGSAKWFWPSNFTQSAAETDKKAQHYGIQKRAIPDLDSRTGPNLPKNIIILSPDLKNNSNPKPKILKNILINDQFFQKYSDPKPKCPFKLCGL